MTATPSPEFTDEQIEQGIQKALHEQNVAVIPSLIALLATQNPHRADDILTTIKAGLALAAATPEGTS